MGQRKWVFIDALCMQIHRSLQQKEKRQNLLHAVAWASNGTRIGNDSGEVRSSTIGGIGAVLLGRLHARAIVVPRTPASLVGNSDFGFRFLGRPEFGIPLPSSEFRNFPAETQIGKPENRSSRKSEFRFRFFRNSGIPLITYIGT
jgi:hypothetical protein